ncbi:MAG TPA: DNA polymerase III subunit delta [Bacteroidia bacterium]|jgi:DNA polymerase-3 subunit delta|nr:DNA polymerase III subunit delta [Bacteroidia bacterium]
MADYNDILLDLKRKLYKPVYFLHGEEPYFIDEISDYIEKNVLEESQKGFNQTVLYGKDSDLSTIIGLAKGFPMMGEKQVIIVKEAQTLKEFARKGADEGDEPKEKKGGDKNPLAAYLENPQPLSILVFCHKYKKLDSRTSLAKTIAKQAVLFESKKLYDDKIPSWITSYLKDKKYNITPSAAALLAQHLGNDLSKIVNELGKLFVSLPEGTEILPDHIQQNIGISKDFNVFELQDALAKKDVLRANRIVQYFAANPKDNPLVLTTASLYGYFHKILLYHFAPDKSRGSIAAALGVNPFFVSGYESAARNYNTGKLKNIFSHLRECDVRSKGVDNVSVEDGDLLKELVFKILH